MHYTKVVNITYFWLHMETTRQKKVSRLLQKELSSVFSKGNFFTTW